MILLCDNYYIPAKIDFDNKRDLLPQIFMELEIENKNLPTITIVTDPNQTNKKSRMKLNN